MERIIIAKLFLFFSMFICVNFFHNLAYSQEKIESVITQEEAARTFLIFPIQGLDKEALDALTSDIPERAFAIGIKEGKTVAVFSKGIPAIQAATELAGVKKEAVETIKYVALNLKSMIDAFKGFKVEQIEIWITAGAETKGFTRLLISAKGEGGIKVMLKPK